MAKLSDDKTYVIVESGDTLSGIAQTYLGAASKYPQLAALNGIPNPDLIWIGQKIMLVKTSGSGGEGSGSGGPSASTGNNANANKAVVTQFGMQSNSNGTLFAVWKWGRNYTKEYKTMWLYDTGDAHWFVGSESSTTYKESTYSIPANAKRVKFKVKPISEEKEQNDKKTSYWTAVWSNEKIYDVKSNPPTTPAVPNVVVEKYKLTAEIDNLNVNATHVQFQVVKNDSKVFKTGMASIITAHAAFSCNVDAGGEYKVRCRSVKNKVYSAWSEYSDNVQAAPSAPQKIVKCRASSETSVYLEWSAVKTAKTYDIEYTTKKEYFDGSDQTTVISDVEFTHYEKTGLESGTRYYFRIRAVNDQGNSGWSGIKSVVIGQAPAAPTTWSSTTTAVTGEELKLYWMHNSEDNSNQMSAELELNIDGQKRTETITNTVEEDGRDKTSVYTLATASYSEGVQIKWRVRTAGITRVYGDWSVQRTVEVYAPPTLSMTIEDPAGNSIDTVKAFPFLISCLAGPNTQEPIGYHLTIAANEMYETVDQTGQTRVINKDEQVYSKYFDISSALHVEMSAGNVDLENNISYKVTCVVSMNSGLTAESSMNINVGWNEIAYIPNAEISFDSKTYAAYIRPYCESGSISYHKVTLSSGLYTKTDVVFDSVYGEAVPGAFTKTGEQVYSGVSDEGESGYYCEVIDSNLIEGITLSVYRREFDGAFTEIASGLKNTKNTFITDPHPALDYARYRIVAVTDATGEVGFYDVPGYFVGETAVIIQWDEDWSRFDTFGDDDLEQPPWSGSLLRLPYNIEVSDKHDPDVSLVEYIGRSYPVSYYGTQKGETSTWNVEIDKTDINTLYGIRRLAAWMGDVYVREPSGSGYWAHITVSFKQSYQSLTIPITFDVARVEGGV